MIANEMGKYVKTCPYLEEFNQAIKANIGCSDPEAVFYSVEEMTCKTVLKKYANGDRINQCNIIICSKESYGTDILQNIHNAGFYEHFANWISDQNCKGILPKLNDGYESIELQALSNECNFKFGKDKARYEIELRLKFYERGGI